MKMLMNFTRCAPRRSMYVQTYIYQCVCESDVCVCVCVSFFSLALLPRQATAYSILVDTSLAGKETRPKHISHSHTQLHRHMYVCMYIYMFMCLSLSSGCRSTTSSCAFFVGFITFKPKSLFGIPTRFWSSYNKPVHSFELH